MAARRQLAGTDLSIGFQSKTIYPLAVDFIKIPITDTIVDAGPRAVIGAARPNRWQPAIVI